MWRLSLEFRVILPLLTLVSGSSFELSAFLRRPARVGGDRDFYFRDASFVGYEMKFGSIFFSLLLVEGVLLLYDFLLDL